MNFSEAEAYLLSLGNEVEAMKLGLENIGKLLAALGNPEKNYLKVQVAGTNGKGSVCAFLDSICREAGIRTGLYTSPHLISVTERIRIEGDDISENRFAELATRVRETSERLAANGEIDNVPTFFEQVTAIALLAFADAGVELAILETGLGGRYDAVTAANAEICAITRIDLDHQEYLGDTIEEIAAEKAAIIRSDSEAVVIGPQVPTVMGLLTDRCSAASVAPRISRGGNTSGSECVPRETEITRLGLKGRHQLENALIAEEVVRALRPHFDITDSQIATGSAAARHPGRIEYHGRFLFDGAHNIGGARALAEYLDEFEHRPITMIFGAMREKQVAEMAEVLWPRAQTIILTQSTNSRALSATEIAEFAPHGFDRGNLVITDSISAAIERAESLTSPDGVILITGSLYLVGDVKKAPKFEI